jgi:hypothetical protein
MAFPWVFLLDCLQCVPTFVFEVRATAKSIACDISKKNRNTAGEAHADRCTRRYLQYITVSLCDTDFMVTN